MRGGLMAPSAHGNGNGKDPVLVVVQLSGGNDFMNTLIPFTEGVYYDSRPLVGIPEDQVLPIDDTLGFHPSAEPPGNGSQQPILRRNHLISSIHRTGEIHIK